MQRIGSHAGRVFRLWVRRGHGFIRRGLFGGGRRQGLNRRRGLPPRAGYGLVLRLLLLRGAGCVLGFRVNYSSCSAVIAKSAINRAVRERKEKRRTIDVITNPGVFVDRVALCGSRGNS